MSPDIVLSVVSPMFNEQETIEEYVKKTINVLQELVSNYELILVDDGSNDNTFSIAKKLADGNKNVRVIGLSRNYGREVAMTAGLDRSIGDYVVLMDSDLQDPPELIPKLFKKIQEGYDVVYAARNKRIGESWFKKFSSKLFYRITAKFTGFDIPENAGDFRIFSRQVVHSITRMKEHSRYLKLLYSYVGYEVGSIEFERAARHAGTSKYNYSKLINAAIDAIISFSNAPLRFMSVLSVLISMISLFYAGYITIEKLFFDSGAIEGWTSIMFMMSLMFSILFLFLAVLSEYISRILVETKKRPLYYIREEYGGTEFKIRKIVDAI